MLLDVSTDSNSATLEVEVDHSPNIYLPEYLEDVTEEARNIAELWLELDDIPGAFDPILQHILGKYTPIEHI